MTSRTDADLRLAQLEVRAGLRGLLLDGGENIRTYPVRITDGQVFIDVADPPAEIIRPELFISLNAAMDDTERRPDGQGHPAGNRIGTPLADVIREGVRYAAPRAEYGGWDHSLANDGGTACG